MARECAYCDLLVTRLYKLQLSVRAHHRVLKLVRTIADMAGSEKI